MDNEQQRVDVLLRMDAAIGSMQMFHLGTEALEEARSAVAELFDNLHAANEAGTVEHYDDATTFEIPMGHWIAVLAALANVGAKK